LFNSVAIVLLYKSIRQIHPNLQTKKNIIINTLRSINNQQGIRQTSKTKTKTKEKKKKKKKKNVELIEFIKEKNNWYDKNNIIQKF